MTTKLRIVPVVSCHVAHEFVGISFGKMYPCHSQSNRLKVAVGFQTGGVVQNLNRSRDGRISVCSLVAVGTDLKGTVTDYFEG